ncbi:MAG: hypothetical protein ACRERE_07120 [Candidatus Entotheonellia bacterium]
MPDREFWRFINTFAPWFSALGSLAAVITALYLAQRDRRLNLSVRAKLQVQLVQGGGPGHGEKLVNVNIVNKGRRVATVTAICWQMGVFKKQTYWQGPPYSSPLPVKLEDGDEVSYRFPTEDFSRVSLKLSQKVRCIAGQGSRQFSCGPLLKRLLGSRSVHGLPGTSVESW